MKHEIEGERWKNVLQRIVALKWFVCNWSRSSKIYVKAVLDTQQFISGHAVIPALGEILTWVYKKIKHCSVNMQLK